MDNAGKTVAIIVAAGSGTRAGDGLPKQFRKIRGRSLIAFCVDAFAEHAGIAEVVLVLGQGQEDMAREAMGDRPLPRVVTGGASRRESVRNALDSLEAGSPPERVLIHDAARPFLPGAVISRLLAALETSQGAVPVLPVVDTVVRSRDNNLGETVPREELHRVQTPQGFRFAAIREAHERWPSALEATDDAQMVRAIGLDVAMVEGDEALQKLTFAGDFGGGQIPVRIGSGYDVHRLVDGEDLWLCGISIEHDKGLAGHSDADVAIHALVDAILGAVGAGDIGDHFPPSDPQWRGASSDRFLSHAIRLARETGYDIGNVDVTIVCEAPRIGPHRQAMRERLAGILGVDIGVINVKATTTEKLGFTGRGEGIAAQAVVSLIAS